MQLWRESHEAVILVALVVAVCVLVFLVVWRRKRRGHITQRQYRSPRKQPHDRNSRPCQHHECGRQPTTRINSEGYPDCGFNGPCCSDCHERHATDRWRRNYANGEGPRCVRDGKSLVLTYKSGYDAYICPQCGGAWIDGHLIGHRKHP